MRAISIAALVWASAAGLALAQEASDDTAIRELSQRGGPVADDGGQHGGRGGCHGLRGGPDGAGPEGAGGPSGPGGPPGPGGPGGGCRGGFGRTQLFISPSGEPFHGKAGEPYPVAAWFAQANKAHDGKLTRAEFVADAEAFFAKVDANHDGVIDGFENQDYEQKIVPEILPQVGRLNASDAGYGPDAPGVGREAGSHRRRSGYQGGGGPPRGRPGGAAYEGAAPYSLINEPQPIEGADTDFNQRISLEEFRKAANERFDLLDKKKLGYLMLAELPKTPVQQVSEQMAEERKKRKDHGGPPTEGDR